MLQRLFSVFYFLSITCYLSAGVKALDWNALEKEICILEHTISDCESEIFPDMDLTDKDPETKMPEVGMFHSYIRPNLTFYPEIKVKTPMVKIINSYSGYIYLTNAP
jgi:hypothetical protein